MDDSNKTIDYFNLISLNESYADDQHQFKISLTHDIDNKEEILAVNTNVNQTVCSNASIQLINDNYSYCDDNMLTQNDSHTENISTLSPTICTDSNVSLESTINNDLKEPEMMHDTIEVNIKDTKHGLLLEEKKEFYYFENNFLKGCKWSPDGSYLLTCSNDNILRSFNFSNAKEINFNLTSRAQEGDTVYDFEWYPFISDKSTCCYLTTSRDQPIHLRSALDGSLLCSYRSFNQMDELASVISLAFSPDGNQIYCGLEKMIRIFDLSRPGREYQSRPTFVNSHGQHGIISCITFNPVIPTMYAAGSYSKSVALYDEPMGEINCMLLGQSGGVTHLKFSLDGNQLYSGGRKDNEILCWDIRNLGHILYVLKRDVDTNQRFYFNFDCSGRYLISGNQDGNVKIWDTKGTISSATSEPILESAYIFRAHNDAVSSISMHPTYNYLASGCGQRHFHSYQFSDSDEEMENDGLEDNNNKLTFEENSIKIWNLDVNV